MAHNPYCAAACSSLLCAENSSTCFNDFDVNADDESIGIPFPWAYHRGTQNPNKDLFFNNHVSKSLMGFIVQSEERVKEMIECEKEFLPRHDYLMRLRSGDLNLSVRREALDWIWKAQAHCNFGPLCLCLSVNYLDRFLSVYELPKGKAWTVQLLAVACLSLAAKMEEIKVPLLVDLQVGEPKFVFEAKTIQRMELLVLITLNWRMLAVTPCSFIDYFLSKVVNGEHDDRELPTYSSISRSLQLILSMTKGIDFLEFRPSEIAAAVAMSVSEREVQAIDVDLGMPRFMHVVKGSSVLKCVDLIKDLSPAADNVASSVPQSPNGVLDAACLSYKSDDVTVGSCAKSSRSVQEIREEGRRERTIPSGTAQVMR